MLTDPRTLTDATVLDAWRNNATQLVKSDPWVYRINTDYVIKVMSRQDAVAHHINRQLSHAIGMNTVDTAVMKMSLRTHAALTGCETPDSAAPYALVMTQAAGEDFVHYAQTAPTWRKNALMKAFAPALITQSALLSFVDMHDENIFVDDKTITVIDYERGLASGWNFSPGGVFRELQEHHACPYFHQPFHAEPLIACANAAKQCFRDVTGQFPYTALQAYRPVIAARHAELVSFLEHRL